jgi:acyl-coenzyme A thioesterase PaaI-like protein
MHGGVIASLLDAAMTHCLFHHEIKAVTGELNIRYLHPVPCSALLEIRSELLSAYNPLYKLQAEIYQADVLMARAEAKFMQYT